MAFDYIEAHEVAADLIEFFGQNADIIKEGNDSGFDENTGAVIPATPDTVISGVVSPLLNYKQSEIDGAHILASDAYVFFESTTAPEISYVITIEGEKCRVVDIKKLTSVDGINVYRKLQLRKG